MGQAALIAFGAILCIALAAVAVLTYRRSRRDRVESPKYKMMDDD